MDANDITLLAADRLEAALERLAVALEAREARMLEALDAGISEAREAARVEAREAGLLQARDATAPARPEDMVSRAEVERLSARLDEALGRLRGVLGEDAGAEI